MWIFLEQKFSSMKQRQNNIFKKQNLWKLKSETLKVRPTEKKPMEYDQT